ncbi:MAG: D-alanyl-D-alanine carboxypeptidase, partial [Desulfobacteraceae bacterium]|nr:D-alanyl-D-alanine carboxypeptidase [Desulfobacteraceae bacterium]
MNKKILKFVFPLCMIGIFLTIPALAMDEHAGVILADNQGKILYSRNKDRQFTPASILKILTSLAAADYFGMDHRFKTLYAYDKITKNLHIKGFGDPLFISEVLQDLCRQISEKTNARTINKIILDQSFFHPDINIPGTGNSLNPYDATSGALCANFNTLSFKWSPIQKGYISAEPQTPLLPDFLEEIKASGQKQGRI